MDPEGKESEEDRREKDAGRNIQEEDDNRIVAKAVKEAKTAVERRRNNIEQHGR